MTYKHYEAIDKPWNSVTCDLWRLALSSLRREPDAKLTFGRFLWIRRLHLSVQQTYLGCCLSAASGADFLHISTTTSKTHFGVPAIDRETSLAIFADVVDQVHFSKIDLLLSFLHPIFNCGTPTRSFHPLRHRRDNLIVHHRTSTRFFYTFRLLRVIIQSISLRNG
jgi:hypothetical protein